MSYSSVSKCRFYIDTFLWYQSVGLGSPVYIDGKTIFDLTPAVRGLPMSEWFYDTPLKIEKINYYALLGHEIPPGTNINGSFKSSTPEETIITATYDWEIIDGVNLDSSTGEVNSDRHGYSIAIVNDVIDIVGHENFALQLGGGASAKIGAFSIGQTYTTPHSPDLKLTLSFETGTKTIETKSGASLSNTMWRPPMWGNLAPWEIYEDYAYQKLARSSRRIWDLSFSFLAKADTFPKYNSLSTYGTSDSADNDPNQYTLAGSEHEGADGEKVGDFYSVVWNRVGNNLPFIFQPDTEEHIYAICKIDHNSLKLTQVAFGVYNVKLKIREVW